MVDIDEKITELLYLALDQSYKIKVNPCVSVYISLPYDWNNYYYPQLLVDTREFKFVIQYIREYIPFEVLKKASKYLYRQRGMESIWLYEYHPQFPFDYEFVFDDWENPLVFEFQPCMGRLDKSKILTYERDNKLELKLVPDFLEWAIEHLRERIKEKKFI